MSHHLDSPASRRDPRLNLTESLTYRVTFEEAGPGGEQALAVTRRTGGDAHDDAAAGGLVAQGVTGAAVDQPDRLR
jgi:hypothetical protein